MSEQLTFGFALIASLALAMAATVHYENSRNDLPDPVRQTSPLPYDPNHTGEPW